MKSLFCVLFLIFTTSNLFAMGSAPSMDETDPIFKKHPANQINNEDVTTLKNIAFTPDGELSDIPILPEPPQDAIEGDQYINAYSSEMCVFRCQRVGGRKAYCGWSGRGGHAFSRFVDPLCQLPTSTPPLLDFNSISHSAGIINLTDLTETAPFSMVIEYEIKSDLFGLEIAFMEIKGIIITKISDDITQEDSAIDSGEWNLSNRYKEIDDLPNGTAPIIKQVPFQVFYANNEIKFKLNGQGVFFMDYPLENGIYGIVVNNLDTTNNQRKALWLPVKFLYIQ